MINFIQFLIEKKSTGGLAREHEPHVRLGMKIAHALTGGEAAHRMNVETFIASGLAHFSSPKTGNSPLVFKNDHYEVTLTHPSKKKIKDLTVRRIKKEDEITADLGTTRGYKSFATTPFSEYEKKYPEFAQSFPIIQSGGKTTFKTGRQSMSAKSTGASREDWAKAMQLNLDKMKDSEDLVLTDTGHVASKKKDGFSIGGNRISNLSDFISGIRLEDRARRSGFHHYTSRGKLRKATKHMDPDDPNSIRTFFDTLQKH